jgi:hypothetical protein
MQRIGTALAEAGVGKGLSKSSSTLENSPVDRVPPMSSIDLFTGLLPILMFL